MQEEVTQKTIALSMKTGKLTAQALQAALKKYLQHRAKGPKLHHGNRKIKEKVINNPTARQRLFSRFFEARCRTSLPPLSCLAYFIYGGKTAYGKKQNRDPSHSGV